MAAFVALYKTEILEMLVKGFLEELRSINEINKGANEKGRTYQLMTDAFMAEKARFLAEKEIMDDEFLELIEPGWTEMSHFLLEKDYFRESLYESGLGFTVYDEDEDEEDED